MANLVVRILQEIRQMQPLYWLRTHTIDRYHLIDIRSARNGYKWGWIDRSDALLFASFALLVDFVEREYPGHVDWKHDDAIRAIDEEIRSLYKWWTKERKEEHDALNAMAVAAFREPKGGGPDKVHTACVDARETAEEKDQRMLRRLVEIRGYLWT